MTVEERAALIAAAIQHVKNVGPNTYEEWVGLIIDFTCISYGYDPIRRPGAHNPETPSLERVSFSSLGRATLP